MEENKLNLNNIYESIWDELLNGAVNRKHPFHLCFFSSLSAASLAPETRIVILREAIKKNLYLRSNCDLRSSKTKEIEKNPETMLMFYDSEKKVQIRIRALSKIIRDKKIVEPIWNASQEISRQCYYTPFSPSSVLKEPFSNSLLNLKGKGLGLSVFGLIVSTVVQIDYLKLKHDGHVRCEFKCDNKRLVKSNWIAP